METPYLLVQGLEWNELPSWARESRFPGRQARQVACRAWARRGRKARRKLTRGEAPQGLPQPGSPDSLADEVSPLQKKGEKPCMQACTCNFLPVEKTGVRKTWDPGMVSAYLDDLAPKQLAKWTRAMPTLVSEQRVALCEAGAPQHMGHAAPRKPGGKPGKTFGEQLHQQRSR